MPSSSHQLFPKKNPWHPRLAHGFSANQRVWAHLPAANGLKSPSKPVACWWQTNLHQRKSTWLAVIYRVLNKYVALKHHNVLDLPGATGLDHHYLLDTCGGKPRCGMVWYGKFGVSAFKHLGKVRCSSLSRSGFALTLQPPGLAQPVRVPTAKSLRAYALAREKSLRSHHISILSILHKNLILTIPRLYFSCACVFNFTATAWVCQQVNW